MSAAPQYTAEQVAKAKAKAARIRVLVDLAGGPGAYGSEGALLVLDGYVAQLEATLQRHTRLIEAYQEQAIEDGHD
jgi:hypothetical protein